MAGIARHVRTVGKAKFHSSLESASVEGRWEMSSMSVTSKSLSKTTIPISEIPALMVVDAGLINQGFLDTER